MKNTTGDPFGDISFIAVMPDGRLLVCYLIKNKIEMLDHDGKFLKEFSVPGIVDKPTFKKLSEGSLSTRNMAIAEGNVLQNCGCDNVG